MYGTEATREGSAGIWKDSALFFATTSLAVNASEARNLCQQQGGQLTSVHRENVLGVLSRLFQSLWAPLEDAEDAVWSSQTMSGIRFWTVGRHLADTNVSAQNSGLYWDDGSQFRLTQRNITVDRPGGCLVLEVDETGRIASNITFRVVDCEEQAFPLCTHYAAGGLRFVHVWGAHAKQKAYLEIVLSCICSVLYV